MPKLDEANIQFTKRVLVYGDPGSGKSELVSKLAMEHELLWFDLEKGSNVLFKLPKEKQKNVTLIAIPDTRAAPMASETMLKVAKRVTGRICYEHGKFNCPICSKLPNHDSISDLVDMQEQAKTNKRIIVIDSLTQFKASCMAHISKGKGDDFKFGFDEWARLNNMVDILLSELQAANYDVVVISHSDMIEKVDGKEQIIPVSSTRNFSRNTGRFFTDVIYAEVKNKNHNFYSASTAQNQIQTKSRSDSKIEEMDKPSLLPFFTHRAKL